MNLQSELPPKPKPKPGSVKVVRALYKYTAKYPDELSFDEGDILYIFDRSNSDWWKAHCKLKSGVIPSNYVDGRFVEMINPLHEAARRGNLEFLKECINQKVSSTELDSIGNTPLYWACQAGHIDCVEYLLNLPNAPLNAKNHFGDSPLHGAAAKNHIDVVHVLINAGADVNTLNHNNETPIQLASNPLIKNLLDKQNVNLSYSRTINVNPEEYEDDSD